MGRVARYLRIDSVGRIPALLQEGSVIETPVEITRGEVPATSPRGIGKNADAAALIVRFLERILENEGYRRRRFSFFLVLFLSL
jgi:hypothetical protein